MDSQPFSEQHVVIAGVGLIGGSLAAALRARFPSCRITGIGRSAERLRNAAAAGLLDDSVTATSRLQASGAIGVVCLPVNQIPDTAREMLQAGCTTVTDAGSVKASVCRELASAGCREFVGSHPIAGREHSGFEHADADLFAGRTCIVTPLNPDERSLRRVCSLWEGVGMSVETLSPEEHDSALARTSHLPHVLASIAAGCVPESLLRYTGTGYRDTTRIAAGSASVWVSILLDNATELLRALETADHQLQQFREALRNRDAGALESLWEANARVRRGL